ncbi:unnamed protein product [Peronospora belbahrii]|uniref:L-ectoine synthase n=1 Tax=Peronospora belbahrii TaxID=622444 RepID=A0AAU9KYG8_9STRA|nr:unnamed protein product [Peronospora belbahrii]CAH0521182.1 unnamed protein product [Peronospora belbahrii]
MLWTLSRKLSTPLSRSLHASTSSLFFIRSLEDVNQSNRIITSENGALETRRYLVRNDECGFSIQQEVLKKGVTIRLKFQNHVYALLITRGNGRVRLLDGPGQFQEVAEGSLVALNAAETIEMEAISDELRAVSVMNPPVFGVEKKNERTGVFPAVDSDGEEFESFDMSKIGRLFPAPESLKGGSAPMKDDPLF